MVQLKKFLDIGYFLYKTLLFIKKDELIAEYSTQTLIPGIKPSNTNLYFY